MTRQAMFARPYPVFRCVGDIFGELAADEGREACPEDATGGGGDGPAAAAVFQGLYTVVHFPAQRKHFLWDTSVRSVVISVTKNGSCELRSERVDAPAVVPAAAAAAAAGALG